MARAPGKLLLLAAVTAVLYSVGQKKASSAIVLGVDEANGVTYQVLTPALTEECIEAMAEAFHQGEPLSKIVGATKKDWLAFNRLYVPRMAEMGLSVIALDTSSGKMIGGFLVEDFATPDPPDMEAVVGAFDGDWTPALACIGELEEALKAKYGEATPGRMIHQWFIGVLPEGRGKNIATTMTSHLLKLAEDKGYELSFAECTGAVSTHILTKLGASIEHFVDYAEYQYEGKALFAPLVAEGHKGMSLAVFQHKK